MSPTPNEGFNRAGGSPEAVPPLGVEDYKKDGDKIIAPRKKIPNAMSARTVYERLRKAHVRRAATFARIDGMIDGNPPYDYSATRRGGLQADSNTNWRDGESIHESQGLGYWSLFNNVQTICKFTTTFGDPAQNPAYGQTVSEEFDKMLRRWEPFNETMALHQADLIKFGCGFLVWTDERSWQFEAQDVYRILVPETSRNNINAINIVAIEQVMTADQIFDIIEKEQGRKDSLWNVDVLKAILWHFANFHGTDRKQYSGQEFAALQTRIRNGDTSVSDTFNNDIILVSMFVTESDGKVSRGIFHPVVQGEKLKDWAYFADRQYDKMSQAIHLFTYKPAQRFVHGNKGLGHRIYNTVEGMTRIDNSVMDQICRSATVLIRSRATRGKDAKQIQYVHGGLVDIGEADFLQNLMGSNIASSIEGVRYFRNKLEQNNSIAGTSMLSPDGKPRTAAEVQVTVTREAKVQKNTIVHYYQQLDTFMEEVVRKVLNCKAGDTGWEEVEEFKKRCIARGVPEDFFKITKENSNSKGLPDHLEVMVTRSGGSGSQAADQIETTQMTKLLPTLGERGKDAVIQDYIAAIRGIEYIPRYYPPEDRTNQPTSEDTLASIENNQLEKGEMVVVSPDNKHAVHAQRHIQRMQQLAQAFNDAADQATQSGSKTPYVDAKNYGQYGLDEVDIAFQTIGPHFVRHLLYISQDPTQRSLAESLRAQWAILANFGDMIANNAQEARTKELRDRQAAQEKLDAIPSEEKVAMAKVDSDNRVKMAKLIAEINRGRVRDQLQYALQREKVSFENEMERSKTFTKLSHDAAMHDEEMRQLQANGAAKTNSEDTTGRKQGELY